jgi:uncharacterized membrane protein YcaP (DUF421 family)
MFDFGQVHVPGLVSTVLRSAIVYLAIYAALRAAGKRHVGQLSIVDFVLVLLVSNAVQNAMVGNDSSLVGGIVAALTLILVNLALTRLVVRHEGLASFLEGEPTLLVRDGRILDGALAREGIRRAELEAAIREHGFKDPGDCRAAILEIDGSISVVGMDDPTRVRRLPPLRHHHHRKAGRRGYKPGQ